MKQFLLFILAIAASMTMANAQCPMVGSHSSHQENQTSKIVNNPSLKAARLKVWGNCTMCKSRIEKALALNGISTAVWDVENKILEVKFDASKIAEEKIHYLVAAAGHDTEKFKAPAEVYNNLPGCCQYNRAEENPDSE